MSWSVARNAAERDDGHPITRCLVVNIGTDRRPRYALGVPGSMILWSETDEPTGPGGAAWVPWLRLIRTRRGAVEVYPLQWQAEKAARTYERQAAHAARLIAELTEAQS